MTRDTYWVSDITQLLVGGPNVEVGVQLVDGRAVITDLILHADGGLSSTDLRTLSLPAMESRAADLIQHRYENKRVTTGDPDFASLRQKWVSTEDAAALARRKREVAKLPVRERLHRPDGAEAGTEGFYSLVADAYRGYSQQTSSPAKSMAD